MKQTAKTLLLAVAVAAAAAGPAFAQSTTWGQRAATFAQDALNWGAVITIICYVLAGVFGIAFVVALFGIGKRNGNSSPGVAICALLAGAFAIALPQMLGTTAYSVTGQAPSITGAGSMPIQFQ